MFSSQFSTRRLAEFCRRVGVSLNAGIDLRKVLDREVDRAAGGQRLALDQVRRAVAGGTTLDEAISKSNGIFPPMVHGMVHVGEQSGRMDEAFLKLAEHYERQLALRRTFIGGIIWPMIQLGAAVVIVGLVIWVMGLISEMVGQDVDILGVGLVGTRGLLIYMAIIAGIAVTGVVLYRAAVAGLAWVEPLQRAVMATPVVGHSLKTLALARLAWTLAVTHDTGMDTIRAVRLAVKNAQNVIFSAGIDRLTAVIRRGGTISEGMQAAGGYPQDFIDALQVGEDTGQISESMAHLSTLYEERAKAALAALTVFAGFIVWGLVAAILILLIFRFAFFYIGQIESVLNGI
jgi:type II secretory pathway component PulF